MKRFFTLLTVFLLTGSIGLSAQDQSPRGEEITLSTDELKSLARKMAELRAQRATLYQQRMLQWQQYYALQNQLNANQQQGAVAGRQPANSPQNRGAYAGQAQPRNSNVNVRIDSRGTYETDTIITINQDLTEDTTIIVRNVNEQTGPVRMNGASGSTSNAELAALRQRLDRQEELLLQIRDGNMMAKSAPIQRDTVVQRMLTNNQPSQLTREDLRRLSDEMGNMNQEISRLRSQVQVEENRRRRAEDRMEDYLRDNRDAIYRNDRDGRSDRLTIQPNIIPDRRPRETVVIRDTVFTERDAPTRVDTVTRIVEAEPQIVRDTVVKVEDRVVTEEVVRTETVQLAAKEPIGFPTVFFDNNSATLNTNHRNIISTMIEDMKVRGDYRVRLTGYASKSGNAEYNQQLSARRAEAVKAGLMQQGIPESQIRIVAGGIDFQAATPAGGRRVEIQAIPQ